MERKWWTLLAVSVATFMLLLDITVVNMALPSIEDDLGASFTDLQWVIDAYALSLAALVLHSGIARRSAGPATRCSRSASESSRSASLLCALLLPTRPSSTLARAQGVGGAVMFAVSLALVAAGFARRPRARHRDGDLRRDDRRRRRGRSARRRRADRLARLGVGLLPQRPDRARRDRRHLPAAARVAHPNATRVDWAGVATFSTALFLLVLALVRGNDEGWGCTMIVSLFAGAAALMAAFVAIESRVKEPMLPLGLFKLPSFTGVQLAAFAVSGSMFALFLYLTLYLQLPRASPLEAGLRYLPITLATFIVAPIAGGGFSRVPARVMMSVGLGGTGAGLLLMSGIGAGDEWTTLLGGFLVAGAASGCSTR